MIIHIKTTEPAARQNLATLYEYVNGDAASWEALLAAMKANPVCGGLVAREAIKLERIEAQAPEEFSAIMSTIQQDLSFLADPLVREKLSRSDVDFAVLKGLGKRAKGGVISVVLPLEYIESHAAITRLALACAVLELQRAPLAKDKVLFLIDEAAALGKILRFPNWLATLRKYRVAIWSIWQNIGQLVHLYDKNWQTIIGNCGLLQILSVGDLETAEYTEKLLGRMTAESVSVNHKGERSRSQTARSLVTADELRRMDRGLQIAFIGNLSPAVLRKTPYWKQGALAGPLSSQPLLCRQDAGAGARRSVCGHPDEDPACADLLAGPASGGGLHHLRRYRACRMGALSRRDRLMGALFLLLVAWCIASMIFAEIVPLASGTAVVRALLPVRMFRRCARIFVQRAVPGDRLAGAAKLAQRSTLLPRRHRNPGTARHRGCG